VGTGFANRIRVNQGLRAFSANPRKNEGCARTPDVGGEYAVYMMAVYDGLRHRNARETGFFRGCERAYSAKVGTGFAIGIRANSID
jgi:hypothetical protein